MDSTVPLIIVYGPLENVYYYPYNHPYPHIYYYAACIRVIPSAIPGDHAVGMVTNRPFQVIAAILPCNTDGSHVSLWIIDLLVCNVNTINWHDNTTLLQNT